MRALPTEMYINAQTMSVANCVAACDGYNFAGVEVSFTSFIDNVANFPSSILENAVRTTYLDNALVANIKRLRK
jgi:hypothetical protein